MITYTEKELVRADELAGNIGGFLNSIRNRSRERIAIVRGDRPEAVLMSADEYEHLCEASELLEHLEIYKTVRDREQTPDEAYITHEEMLQKLEGEQE